jgi:hypothetical protein
MDEEKQNQKKEKPEIKSFKFYSFTPGTPEQVAYRGLIVLLIVGVLISLVENSDILSSLEENSPILNALLVSIPDALAIIGFLGILTVVEGAILIVINPLKMRKKRNKESETSDYGKK